jgi:DNA-3-methyladenine glycosylase I
MARSAWHASRHLAAMRSTAIRQYQPAERHRPSAAGICRNARVLPGGLCRDVPKPLAGLMAISQMPMSVETFGGGRVTRQPRLALRHGSQCSSRSPQAKRCSWVTANDPLLLEYHDREWGVPAHSDQKHFEVLVLSGAQAGLNWSLVLKKREGYRRAFDKFDPEKVARFSERQIARLVSDPEIIRNRLKIQAAVRNARAFLKVQEEFGEFDSYCWGFVGGRPQLNRWKATRQIPATSPESKTFSKDLKHRGFSFVGPTVVYAFMQAVGMVNDHLVDCFRYREILREGAS